jgi:hypothetical protein
MRHEDDPVEVEAGDDGVEVLPLVGERVIVVPGLVRFAPAEEIERHDGASLDVRHQAVIEVVVVGKAVHQDDRGSGAVLFSDEDAMLGAPNPEVCESHHRELPFMRLVPSVTSHTCRTEDRRCETPSGWKSGACCRVHDFVAGILHIQRAFRR